MSLGPNGVLLSIESLPERDNVFYNHWNMLAGYYCIRAEDE